ncbi:nitroreductase family protein [Candidatus Pacearchaeota archaeon]|nr:nitroreductase family protein [Candidatus Pacearchaeota archaeon]
MQLDKAIESRKSIRNFKDKKPDWRDIIECIDAMRYGPMAGNIFSLKFILVSDQEKIKKLAQAAQQDFINQVSHVVVVCTDSKQTNRFYESERGERYCRQQAGAAIQNFLLKIEQAGLSTCWIGHFVDEQVKEILKIPEDIFVEAFFPIGYTSNADSRKKRGERKINLDNILYFDKYNQKKMKTPKKFEV